MPTGGYWPDSDYQAEVLATAYAAVKAGGTASSGGAARIGTEGRYFQSSGAAAAAAQELRGWATNRPRTGAMFGLGLYDPELASLLGGFL